MLQDPYICTTRLSSPVTRFASGMSFPVWATPTQCSCERGSFEECCLYHARFTSDSDKESSSVGAPLRAKRVRHIQLADRAVTLAGVVQRGACQEAVEDTHS